MINWLILIAIGIFVAVLFLKRDTKEPPGWQPLPSEPQPFQVAGQDEPIMLPQYGYIRWRNSFYIIKQTPAIVLEADWLAGEAMVAYKYISMMDGKEGYAPAESVTLVGTEMPELFIKE